MKCFYMKRGKHVIVRYIGARQFVKATEWNKG